MDIIESRNPILFVADDGPKFGLGRLRRVEYLQRTCAPQTRELIRLLSRTQHRPTSPSRDNGNPFWMDVHDLIVSEQPRLCVFDIEYSEWLSHWGRIRESIPSGARVIGIDVPLNWISEFDEVIHPGVAGPLRCRSYPHWHGGPEWVLVDRHPTWNPVTEVLKITATTGSVSFTSFFGWLEQELEVFAERGAEVSWVVGKHKESLGSKLATYPGRVNFVNDRDLIQRFTSSVFVLARFGVTVYELAARGVPTIVLPGWHPEENPEILELERNEVVLVARSESEVRDLGSRLLCEEELRQEISETSRAYFGLSAVSPAADLIDRLAWERR